MKSKEGRKIFRLLLYTLFFAVIWYSLSGGAAESWVIGGPVILFSLIATAHLPTTAPWRWHLAGVLKFIPFFIWQSVYSGIDVAYRALHPALPVEPDLFDFRVRLPPGLARISFVNTVSMLPGTLSADLKGDVVTVHGLVQGTSVQEKLRVLEDHIADFFGLEIASNGGEFNE